MDLIFLKFKSFLILILSVISAACRNMTIRMNASISRRRFHCSRNMLTTTVNHYCLFTKTINQRRPFVGFVALYQRGSSCLLHTNGNRDRASLFKPDNHWPGVITVHGNSTSARDIASAVTFVSILKQRSGKQSINMSQHLPTNLTLTRIVCKV
jgi:hypothetical protein